MKQLLFTLLTFIICANAVAQAKQFSYNNERRRYMVYLPSGYHQKTIKNYPVVFNFHGGGMTMTEQMFYTGMNATADKHEFIVVYPQGVKQDWNVGFEMSYKFGTDDIGFIKALLASIEKEYRVDKLAVYATGLSRGGFFSLRLAAELPEKFAAVASIGGPMPDSVAYFHQNKIPVGVMIVHGTSDEIVKHDGKPNAYFSAAASYDYWKKNNGLMNIKDNIKTIDKIQKDSTSVTITESSSKGSSVSLVSIKGGGHTWPGAHPFNIGFPLGKTSSEIDINEVIWKFFIKNKRKN